MPTKMPLLLNKQMKLIKISDGGYLDVDAIINAAKISKAEAIHPGYGFLSENALFAKKIQKEKLIWIGPGSEIISKMGDKLEAQGTGYSVWYSNFTKNL